MAIGAAAVLVEVALEPITFARRAVESGVSAFINVAVFLKALEKILDDFLMAGLGRSDEVVVGDVEAAPEFFERLDDGINVLERRQIMSLSGALKFLSVLVGAGQKKYVVIGEPLISGDRVGDRRAIRVPDVQLLTRIINRRRDVKIFFHETASVNN